MRKMILPIAVLVIGATIFGMAKDYTPKSVQGVAPATAINVTNTEAITISPNVRYYNVNGTNGADNTTNTITLIGPTSNSIGQTVTLIVNTDSSNLVGLADSGTLALSAAVNMDNNDNITLYGFSTGLWVEISVTDN